MFLTPLTGNWLLFVIDACIVSVKTYNMKCMPLKKFFPQEAQKSQKRENAVQIYLLNMGVQTIIWNKIKDNEIFL